MKNAEKIEQLSALLASDPADSLGHFMLGKLYLDEERFIEAAESFGRCLELDPEYSAAWRFRGDAWRKAGEPARARETYEKGIEVADRRGDLQTVKEMRAFLARLDE